MRCTSAMARPLPTAGKSPGYSTKRHADVLRAVEKLCEINADVEMRWLKPAVYVDAQGKQRPFYELTKDGFTLLAMGFTGEKALAFKIAYIERFNRMDFLQRSAA